MRTNNVENFSKEEKKSIRIEEFAIYDSHARAGTPGQSCDQLVKLASIPLPNRRVNAPR